MGEQHNFDSMQDRTAPAHAAPSVPEVAAPEASAPEASVPEVEPAAEQGVPQPAPAPQPFVRQRAPHRTQEAINDLAQPELDDPIYAHDSNVSVRGGAFSGREYRRSRSSMSKVQGGRYGQYLEIPKGRRSIFASQERRRRRNSLVAAFFVIAFLAVVAVIIWQLIERL